MVTYWSINNSSQRVILRHMAWRTSDVESVRYAHINDGLIMEVHRIQRQNDDWSWGNTVSEMRNISRHRWWYICPEECSNLLEVRNSMKTYSDCYERIKDMFICNKMRHVERNETRNVIEVLQTRVWRCRELLILTY